MKPLLSLIVLVLMVGCFKPEPQPNMPLSGIGVVTGNQEGDNQEGLPNSHLWLTYVDGQMVEYNLCPKSPNLVATGEGVNISFTWDSHSECYTMKDAYQMKELDAKK